MNIREMEQRDLEAVSAICIDSFSQSVAGSLSAAGVSTFNNIAASSALLATALRYAWVDTVTVKASLSSVVAYEKYGFKCNGGIAETAGLVFQPMEIERNKFKPSRAL